MDNLLTNGLTGDPLTTLMAHNMDPAVLRPYRGDDGRSYITLNGQAVVTNANAVLRKDEWILLDEVVIKAAKERLKVFGDLRSAGLTFNIPNGMSKTVLEHQTQSDISEATISMDGLRRSDSDRPEYTLESLPLPITHKDFSFSARQIMVSRNGGSPLDTSTAELASRRVSEEIEKLTLGESSSFTYGGGTIYGYTNFPQRLTKTLTDPTSANHATTVAEVLQMKTQSQNAKYYGPWVLYNSNAWDAFLDEDYSTAKGDNTLRERLRKIEGIIDVRTSDFLSGTTLILVQQTTDVARAVIGMDITTMQWETHGGMELNFKVMAILVPQLRSDFNNNTGIVHGSV